MMDLMDLLAMMQQDAARTVADTIESNERIRQKNRLEAERRAELERLEHEQRKVAIRRQIAEDRARAVFAEAITADFLAWLEDRKRRAQWWVMDNEPRLD